MSYWDTFYYYLGYEMDIEPDEKSKNIRHECMKQIKFSKLNLKCVETTDKTNNMINNKECIEIIKEKIEEKKETKFLEIVEENNDIRIDILDIICSDTENDDFDENGDGKECSSDDIKKFIEDEKKINKNNNLEKKPKQMTEYEYELKKRKITNILK